MDRREALNGLGLAAGGLLAGGCLAPGAEAAEHKGKSPVARPSRWITSAANGPTKGPTNQGERKAVRTVRAVRLVCFTTGGSS
jgi:hypothetical protein